MSNFDYLDYFSAITNEELLNFLKDRFLIKQSLFCDHCSISMTLKKTTDNYFGYNYRCLNMNCDKYQTTSSIFRGSFFEKSKVSVRLSLRVLFYFSKGACLSEIMRYTTAKSSYLKRTKAKILSMIEEYYSNNPTRLGGLNIRVNIDETKLNHNVRAHRGRGPNNPTWAITFADTSTAPSKGYTKVVENRSAHSLIPIILEIVRPGSIIVTDEWRAYNALSRHPEFLHERITHKYNFVDPITNIHTQHVESYNNKLKLFLKNQKGCVSQSREKLLTYFRFVDDFKENAFEKLLEIIKI